MKWIKRIFAVAALVLAAVLCLDLWDRRSRTELVAQWRAFYVMSEDMSEKVRIARERYDSKDTMAEWVIIGRGYSRDLEQLSRRVSAFPIFPIYRDVKRDFEEFLKQESVAEEETASLYDGIYSQPREVSLERLRRLREIRNERSAAQVAIREKLVESVLN